MDRQKLRPGIVDNVGICVFWLIVLGVLIGLPSCGLLHAEPIKVTKPPVIVVTQPPVIRASGAVETGSTEQSPPSNAAIPHRSGRRPQLLVFTCPDWCAPCRTLEAELRGLREMPVGGVNLWADEIGPGEHQAIRVIDASCEPSPERDMATARKVTTWPTIIRLDANGKETSRTTGVINAVTLSRYQAGTWSPAGAVAVKPAANGVHTHRCQNCSTQWSHGEEAAGNARAHHCPNCGTEQYEIDHFGGVRYAAPVQTQQPKRVGFIRSLFGG